MVPLVSYKDGRRFVIGEADVVKNNVKLYTGKHYIGEADVDGPTELYLQRNTGEANSYDIAPFFKIA